MNYEKWLDDESPPSLHIVDPLDGESSLFITLSLDRKLTIAEWENEATYPHNDLVVDEPT